MPRNMQCNGLLFLFFESLSSALCSLPSRELSCHNWECRIEMPQYFQVAFFLDPNEDFVVECLKSCCSEASPPRYKPPILPSSLVSIFTSIYADNFLAFLCFSFILLNVMPCRTCPYKIENSLAKERYLRGHILLVSCPLFQHATLETWQSTMLSCLTYLSVHSINTGFDSWMVVIFLLHRCLSLSYHVPTFKEDIMLMHFNPTYWLLL